MKTNKGYSEDIDSFETFTPIHSDYINGVFSQLLSNDAEIKKNTEEKISECLELGSDMETSINYLRSEIAALKARLNGISFGTDEDGRLTYKKEEAADENNG